MSFLDRLAEEELAAEESAFAYAEACGAEDPAVEAELGLPLIVNVDETSHRAWMAMVEEPDPYDAALRREFG